MDEKDEDPKHQSRSAPDYRDAISSELGNRAQNHRGQNPPECDVELKIREIGYPIQQKLEMEQPQSHQRQTDAEAEQASRHPVGARLSLIHGESHHCLAERAFSPFVSESSRGTMSIKAAS
jgi:hypothetical protein